MKQETGASHFYVVLKIFVWAVLSLSLFYFCYLKIGKNPEYSGSMNKGKSFDKDKSISASKLQTMLINVSIGNLLMINSILTVPFFCVLFPVFYCT